VGYKIYLHTNTDQPDDDDDVHLDKLQTRGVKKIYPLHVKHRLQPIRHKQKKMTTQIIKSYRYNRTAQR
jgi:hypothetical protein